MQDSIDIIADISVCRSNKPSFCLSET